MNKKYIIEEQSGVTIIKFLKRPTYGDCKTALDDLAENYSYKLRLWDLTETKFSLTIEEVNRIAEYGKSIFKNKNRAAFVVSSELAHNELQIFTMLRDHENTDLKIFRSKDDAILWLKSTDPTI